MAPGESIKVSKTNASQYRGIICRAANRSSKTAGGVKSRVLPDLGCQSEPTLGSFNRAIQTESDPVLTPDFLGKAPVFQGFLALAADQLTLGKGSP